MKKALSLLLCFGLIFGLVGCRQKNSPTARERKLTQQLIDAKYLQGSLNGSITADMEGMGRQTLNISGDFQSDISQGYPKLKLDGSISLGELMSMPMRLFMDENSWSITLFGQTQNNEISDDKKAQNRTIIEQLSSNQATIARTAKETTVNDQQALEIHYDVNQINSLLSMSGNGNSSIEQLTMHYILNENGDIKQIDIYTIGSFPNRLEMKLSFLFTSIGEPFTISQ